jgi:hypothetical protein
MPDIRRTVDSGYDEMMTSGNGHRIDQMVPDLQNAHRHDRPVVAVIENLGSNNVIHAATYAPSLTEFDRPVSITGTAARG